MRVTSGQRRPRSSARVSGVECALCLVGVLAGVALPAARPVSAEQRVTIAPAGAVTWRWMLEHEAQRAKPDAARVVVRRMPVPPPVEIGPPRGGPAVPATPLPPPESEPEALGPTVTASFQALPDNNNTIPPDTMGAVGPVHVMTMLNTGVRVQDKTGAETTTVSLSTFWTAGTGLTGDPFDPKLVYDSLSARWIAAADANATARTSQVWLAISATSDPTGVWTFYSFAADPSFPNGGTWADFPGLGVNDTWIAISNNMFRVGGNTFVAAKMWVVDKATALTGGSLTVTVFEPGFDSAGGLSGFTLQPAVTFGPEPTLYVVDNSGYSSGGIRLLRLSRITGTGPAPVWSVQPGSSFAGTGLFLVGNNFSFTQVGAEQLGTTGRLDSGDPRVVNVVFRNGRIWYAHTGGLPIGAVDRTAAFWYQLDPTSMPVPIVQSGVLDGGAGAHHLYPSIAVNAAADVVIGFSRTDPTRFAEAAYTGRLATDPPGAMDPISVLKLGEDSYVKDFGSGSIRWGDYSATVVDPTDDLTFWTIQEYAADDVGPNPSDDRWGTWWGRVTVPTGAATPSAAPTATASPSSTATASATSTATPSVTSTPTASATPTRTTTATRTATATTTTTPTTTPTRTATPTQTATATRTATVTATTTPTNTATPSSTRTATPTSTPTPAALLDWTNELTAVWYLEEDGLADRVNSSTDTANGIACGPDCNLFTSGSIAQLLPGQEGTAAASFVKSQQRRLLCGSSSCPELGFADQSSFTVGCWARPTLEANADLLFRGRFTNVTPTKGYRMARASIAGNVFLRCMIGDGVLTSATGTVATSLVGTFAVNVWTHVACRFDSSQSPPPPEPPDRRWQAFVNGAASGAVKATGAVHDISSEFSLGANQFNPSTAYEGALDECFVTAQPLSEAALCRIARCGIRGEQCRCDAANPALYAVSGRGLENCVAGKCDSGAKLNAACNTDEDCRCSLTGVACNAPGP